MITKHLLRQQYRNKRKDLTMVQMHLLLASMAENFNQVPLPDKKLVLSYRTIVEKKEVPANIFEQLYFDEKGPCEFCYPKADFGSGEMIAYLENDDIEWEQVGFGLTQPNTGTIVNPAEIDIVFVPLLAFDYNGFRLGYGKGFYDRYLNQCRPDVKKIGFCWFEAEISLPEIGTHDVPLNYCVTPQRLYVF